MATDTATPWAEPALITAEILQALEDDTWRYELVEGRLIRMPPASFEHGGIEAQISSALLQHVRGSKLGRVVVGETGFLLSRAGEPDTVLAPDVAFIRADRVPSPGSPDATGFARLCPDFVVEIGSPSQGRSELGAKASRWLRYGARLVWVVWPAQREVDVWDSNKSTEPRTLTSDDALDGEDILPSFSLPVSQIFS